MIHIAYLDNKHNILEEILNGKRTMLLKNSASRKIPHSRIFTDDEIYFVEKGTNEISVKALVKEVTNYSKLRMEDIKSILDENDEKLSLTEKEIEKINKKCICLIELYNVQNIDKIECNHNWGMEDWLIGDSLEEINN